MKLSPYKPPSKPARRPFRQTRVTLEMEAAFSVEIQKHGLSRIKALTMLLEQYNANPWPFHPKPDREESLNYTWAAFPADVDLVDTFTAYCAAAGVSTGEGVRQIVQRCLDTASGNVQWDLLATLLGPDARFERREGLPTMGDLRKAFDDELVCRHVVAESDSSIANFESVERAIQAGVNFGVREFRGKSGDQTIPFHDSWTRWALDIYMRELAMARLGREPTNV